MKIILSLSLLCLFFCIGYSTRFLSLPLQPKLLRKVSIDKCLENLRVSPENGLTFSQISERQQSIGLNQLPEPQKPHFMSLLIDQFRDRLVQILLSVAILSSIISYYDKNHDSIFESGAIFTILILNSLIGIYQNRAAEQSLNSLKKMQSEYSTVKRYGDWLKISSKELVPGDIIRLRVGDRVPADCRLLSLLSPSLRVDESCLTGESESVEKIIQIPRSTAEGTEEEEEKEPRPDVLYSGTLVTKGSCTALVYSTGVSTEMGQVCLSAQQGHPPPTPLSRNLEQFGSQLGQIVLAISTALWIRNIPNFFRPQFSSGLAGALHYLKSSVVLGVAAIPEGLPAIVTLCLAMGTQRLAKKNVIVRKLSSVETLGCTSVICTDKTGTLTANKMTATTLMRFRKNGNKIETIELDPTQNPPKEPSPVLSDISSIASLCNDASLQSVNGTLEMRGEPTEVALQTLARQLTSQSNLEPPSFTRLAVLEFDRIRKSMGVLLRRKGRKGVTLFVKGAAEVLLDRCSRVKLDDSTIVKLTPQLRAQILTQISGLQRQALRSLAFAYRDLSEASTAPFTASLNRIASPEEASQHPIITNSSTYSQIESDLVLVGVAGILDPPREEVANSVSMCKKAGIRVMMMTGDSKETAAAIARKVNIFDENQNITGHVFSGREFFSLPEHTQLSLLREGNKVFCRTDPQDKQKLVLMLEKLGEVPAMTGDGVNDAPALRQAAIGIAMGVTGTEVAKEAADMILTDDNFSTLVSAVEEGRNIYSKIQSFVLFLLSCNLGEVCSLVGASLLGLPDLFTPFQLLWVNLVSDGPPALALAFNPSDPQAMHDPPRRASEPIFSPTNYLRFLSTGVYVGLATIMAYLIPFSREGVGLSQLRHWEQFASPHFKLLQGKASSSALNVLVIVQLLKALCSVSLDKSLSSIPFWRNPYITASVLLPFLAQLGIMYWPLASNLLGISPLTYSDWKVVMALSLPILLLDEAMKWKNEKLCPR